MCQAGSATLLPSDGKARVKQFNVSVVRLGCWVFTFSRQMPAPGRQQAHSGSEVCSSKWERGVPSSLAQLKLSIHFTNTFSKIEKYTLQGQIRFGTLTRLNVGRCVLLHCPIKTELSQGSWRSRALLQNAFPSLSNFLNLPALLYRRLFAQCLEHIFEKCLLCIFKPSVLRAHVLPRIGCALQIRFWQEGTKLGVEFHTCNIITSCT